GRLLEGDLVLRAVHAYAAQNTLRSAGRSLRHQPQHQAVCEENGVPTGERHQGDRPARDFRPGETLIQRTAGRDAGENGNALLRMYPRAASRAFGWRSAGERSQSSGDETQRDRQISLSRPPRRSDLLTRLRAAPPGALRAGRFQMSIRTCLVGWSWTRLGKRRRCTLVPGRVLSTLRVYCCLRVERGGVHAQSSRPRPVIDEEGRK